MPWIPRGLREGIVTTRYPRRSDTYGEGFRAAVVVGGGPYDPDRMGAAVAACPTNAISFTTEEVQLDRGCCILCGRCTTVYPEAFGFTSDFEAGAFDRRQLMVPEVEEDDAAIGATRAELARRTRALRRSVHVRHVDAGSDGAEEWEVAALTNPMYDVQRLGILFTASPKHADVLLVTGVGSSGMFAPLRHTFHLMPEPKIVIAAGVDAISGGLIGAGYAAHGGIDGAVPVDVFVPGSPPSPFALLHGILLAVGILSNARFSHVRDRGETLISRPPSEDPPMEAGQ